MSKKPPGLTQRNGTWHINKVIKGRRLYESTGTGVLEEAIIYYERRVPEFRDEIVNGVRKVYLFIDAATKFLKEEDKTSIGRDADTLKVVMPYIGHLPLDQIHMGTLDEFISDRKAAGIKNSTINRDLVVIRRVLKLAADFWRDANGKPWLDKAPLLRMLKNDNRKPYPISPNEEQRLTEELPSHLQNMVNFALNTGCREKEITGLKWSEYDAIQEVFIIPGDRTKNGQDKIVPLNSITKSIIAAQRGKNDEFVFTFKGKPVKRINGHAWRKARERAGSPQCRVHDLRHTFGQRLRRVGVSYETRQDLLGHKSNRITDHYCKAEIDELREAVEKLA